MTSLSRGFQLIDLELLSRVAGQGWNDKNTLHMLQLVC